MANAGTVSVAFKATGLSKFKSQAESAARATDSLSDGLQSASASAKSFGQAAAQAGKLGAGMAAAAAASGFAISKSAKAAGEFEQTMTKVGLVSGATERELAMLTAEAIRLGQVTQFSPDQAAGGFLTLGQSGKTAAQQIGLMEPVLNLAAAGQIEVAEAAAIATRSMAAFGLGTGDIAGANDKLLKVTQMLDINMNQISDQFGKTAGKMGAFGQSFDTVALTLGLATAATGDAAMAQASLATATANLQKKAKDLQKDLGVNVFDRQTGAARQLDAVLLDMQSSMASMTEEQQAQILTTYLGSRGILAFSSVTKAAAGENLRGAEAVAELRNQLAQSTGTTQKFTDSLLDTFSGKTTLMIGSMQTLVISLGMTLKEVLQPGIEFATFALNGMISALQAIPGPIKTVLAVATVGFVGLTGAIGTALVTAAGFAATAKSVTAALAGTTLGAKLAEVGFMGLGRAALVALLPALAVVAKLGVILGIVALVIGRFAAEGEAAFFHLRDAVSTMVAHVQFTFSKMMKFVTGVIQSGLSFIGSAFKFVFGGVLSVVKAVFQGIVAAMSGAVNLVSKGVGSIVDVYGELLFALGQEQEAAALRGVIKDLKNFDIGPAFDDAIKGSSEALGQIGTSVKGWASYTGKIVGETVSGIGMQFKSNAVGMAKTVKSELTKSVEGLMGLLGGATDDMDKLGDSAKKAAAKFKGLKLPDGGDAGAAAAAAAASAGEKAPKIATRPREDFGEFANALDQMRGQRADRQQGAISAAQGVASGNISQIGQGVASALGASLGPVGGAALGLVDSLMSASTEGAKFKEDLAGIFTTVAQALNPLFKALRPVLELFQVLGELVGMFIEIAMASSLLQPALMIIAQLFRGVALIIKNLMIGFRAFYLSILRLIDAIPGVDMARQIREVERAQAREVRERNELIERMRGEATLDEQRARRERELAAATREATSAMLNVPSGYKVARAGFGAEAPMNDFISRPGQRAVPFSPQDNVIGVKDLGSLGGTTIVIQNLDVRSDNPTQFFRSLMDMVNRDTAAGGVALGGNFQGRL